MENFCFICGLDRFKLDTTGPGFDHHVAHDHNMWAYLYLIIYLKHKDPTEYNGWEQHVASKAEREDASFFPRNAALGVGSDDEDEAGGGGDGGGDRGGGGAAVAALGDQLAALAEAQARMAEAIAQLAAAGGGGPAPRVTPRGTSARGGAPPSVSALASAATLSVRLRQGGARAPAEGSVAPSNAALPSTAQLPMPSPLPPPVAAISTPRERFSAETERRSDGDNLPPPVAASPTPRGQSSAEMERRSDGDNDPFADPSLDPNPFGEALPGMASPAAARHATPFASTALATTTLAATTITATTITAVPLATASFATTSAAPSDAPRTPPAAQRGGSVSEPSLRAPAPTLTPTEVAATPTGGGGGAGGGAAAAAALACTQVERPPGERVHGWLYKKGDVNPAWRRRYFALAPLELRWWDSLSSFSAGLQPAGRFPLGGVAAVDERPATATGVTTGRYQLVLAPREAGRRSSGSFAGRSSVGEREGARWLELEADSPGALQRWLAAIRAALVTRAAMDEV